MIKTMTCSKIMKKGKKDRLRGTWKRITGYFCGVKEAGQHLGSLVEVGGEGRGHLMRKTNTGTVPV